MLIQQLNIKVQTDLKTSAFLQEVFRGQNICNLHFHILINFQTLCCISPLKKLTKSGVDNLERLYKKVVTVTFAIMY